MHETIVQSVKAFISPKFIKAQHYKHHGKSLYKERNSIYYANLHLFRLQYNLLIGCSTIWHKYGIIIEKFRMFIFVTMEMEKLYTRIFQKYTHIYTHSHMHTHIHIPYMGKFWQTIQVKAIGKDKFCK